MSKLKEIKERAEVNAVLGKTASQDEAKDTLKLVAALEAVERAVEAEVEHFREGLVPADPVSRQHIANSNRAFGADCALTAVRDVIAVALA